MKNQLEDLRKIINEIDESIIILLAKRTNIVKKIGKYKKANNLPPLDKNRWQKVLTSKMEKAKALGLNPKLIKKIWNHIHEQALEIEKK